MAAWLAKEVAMRRLFLVAALAATTWWLLAATATGGEFAATPYADIASAGPLTHVCRSRRFWRLSSVLTRILATLSHICSFTAQ